MVSVIGTSTTSTTTDWTIAPKIYSGYLTGRTALLRPEEEYALKLRYKLKRGIALDGLSRDEYAYTNLCQVRPRATVATSFYGNRRFRRRPCG